MKSLLRNLLLILAVVLAPMVWAKTKTASKSSSKSSASASDTSASSTPATPTTNTAAPADTAKIYTTQETAPLIAAANATLQALAAAKKADIDTKITELESAWDAQEKNLKPRDEAHWTTIDKTLDKAISSIRGSKFDAVKGKAALDSLVKLLTASTKDGQ
jgi:hypothetical protein